MQVICPYCHKKYAKLTPLHLKGHGKTKWEVREEFPEIPMAAIECVVGGVKANPKNLADIEYTNYKDRRIRQNGGVSKIKAREV